MIYRPPRAQGTLTGLGLAAWAFAMAALLTWRGATWPVSPEALLAYGGAAVAVGIGLLLAYWSYTCLSLHCIIGRDALTIVWGNRHVIIPLKDIHRLVPGYSLPEPRVRGLNWRGYHVGRATLTPLGETYFYSTHRTTDDLLYILTAERSYAVAANNLSELARDIQLRQRLAVDQPIRPELLRTLIKAPPVRRDRWLWPLSLIAAVLGLTLVAYVFVIYPDLPQTLSLPFAPIINGEHSGPKSELLKIPIAAMAVLAINATLALISHREERGITYVLLATALGAQVILWVATGLAVVQRT